MVRHPACDSLGRTQPDRVIASLRSNAADAGTRTVCPAPSNRTAEPNRPRDVQVAPEIVPVLPLPDASAALLPEPASNPYAATRPTARSIPSLGMGVDISA